MRKVIVAGGRDFTDKTRLYNVLDKMFIHPDAVMPDSNALEIVCGGARGADSLGDQWAITNWVPVQEFPGGWATHGKSAGHRRNVEVASYADVLVAFWDGESKGTRHMIDTALKSGLEVHVYRYSHN